MLYVNHQRCPAAFFVAVVETRPVAVASTGPKLVAVAVVEDEEEVAELLAITVVKDVGKAALSPPGPQNKSPIRLRLASFLKDNAA